MQRFLYACLPAYKFTLTNLLCFSTFCFRSSFLFASLLVLLQLFSGSLLRFSREELLFSGVLLFDFMALHMRRAAVCKFAGSRFALVVPFLRCRGLVSNWMFTGESIHQ